MTKKALVLLADGFEEVEAVTPITYLRRGGIEVTTVFCGTSDQPEVHGVRGIKIIANTSLATLVGGVEQWDAVIVPGGVRGAEYLAACEATGTLLQEAATAGKLICAICAAPALVLAPLGLLAGKKFTCYPGFEENVTDGEWLQDRVVVDGNIITSRAAGTSGEFAIAIIENLLGQDAAQQVAESVLLY